MYDSRIFLRPQKHEFVVEASDLGWPPGTYERLLVVKDVLLDDGPGDLAFEYSGPLVHGVEQEQVGWLYKSLNGAYVLTVLND